MRIGIITAISRNHGNQQTSRQSAEIMCNQQSRHINRAISKADITSISIQHGIGKWSLPKAHSFSSFQGHLIIHRVHNQEECYVMI